MFKFLGFTKVETEYTVLDFHGGDDSVTVNHFDVDVVSVSADNEADIDALIASQPSEINCVEITHEKFKELVGESAQLKRIREVVACKIAEKYTFADELSLRNRDTDDVKRVAYELYVAECLAVGYGLKAEIGY